MAKPTAETTIVPEIKKFNVKDIRPAEYNPRTISKDALTGLTNSIGQFGCVEPIIVNVRGGKNVIVGGHQRLKAIKRLKQKSVVCVTVDLDKKQERALNITLNNPEIQGSFIADMVEQLDKLRRDIGDTEFAQLRLDKLREQLEQREQENKFHFRPGEGAIKFAGGLAGYKLKRAEIRRFDKFENFILDFSGGRDSTLALAWMAEYFPDKKLYAVYSDVGVEFPGMGAHIEKTCDFFKAECVILKPKKEWWAWLRQEGQWPSLIYRKCQTEFIFKVTGAFRKKFPKETTLLLDGSRGNQSTRGSKKSLVSPLGSLPGFEAYHPCFNLTDANAEQLLTDFKAPLWEGYSMGFVRIACWCCPGQCGLQALALEENYPGLANSIRRWEKILGIIKPMNDRSFDDTVRAGRKQRQQQAKKAATVSKPKKKTKKKRSVKK